MIRRAWERMEDKAQSRGHRIVIQTDERLPWVRGDVERCGEVLGALLDNAILYTAFGGVIRLSIDSLGTHVLFGVEDSGVGLTDDDLAHIGEPYWRGMHHPLVRQQPGSGLSLHVAREVLLRQEGELFFSGEEGEGSTFSFALPAAR
jgi:signal transduction histidine kinase